VFIQSHKDRFPPKLLLVEMVEKRNRDRYAAWLASGGIGEPPRPTELLFIPPYHCDFAMIELSWRNIKEVDVRARNTTKDRVGSVEQLIRDGIERINQSDLPKKWCDRVKRRRLEWELKEGCKEVLEVPCIVSREDIHEEEGDFCLPDSFAENESFLDETMTLYEIKRLQEVLKANPMKW